MTHELLYYVAKVTKKSFLLFFSQKYQRSKHIVEVIVIYIDYFPISLKGWNIIEEKTKCFIKLPKISMKLRTYHWSSDHRCLESIIEVQTIEAQKASYKFRNDYWSSHRRSTTQMFWWVPVANLFCFLCSLFSVCLSSFCVFCPMLTVFLNCPFLIVLSNSAKSFLSLDAWNRKSVQQLANISEWI